MAVHTGADTSSAHSASADSRHSIRRTALLLVSTLLVACGVPSARTQLSPTMYPTVTRSPTPSSLPAAAQTSTPEPAPAATVTVYLSPVDGECREYFDEANAHTNVWYDAGPGRELRAIADGKVMYHSSLVGPPEAPQLAGLALELADGATIFMIVAEDGGKFNPLELGQLVKRGDVVGLTGNAINHLGITGGLVVTRPGTNLRCREFSAH